MDINIESQIVVKTAAEWAADSTVYSDKRVLVTSDEYFLAADPAISYTNQRRFKIADGVNTWSALNYFVDPGGVYIQLQAEITERNNEDDAIRNDITNEAFYRSEADTNLQSAIDSINNRVGQPDGIASLGSDGKIPTSQLPAVAITDVSVVNSQAAQLALTAEEGDVAVRTDLNKTYMHNGGTTGTMADWQEMLTPTDAVISVNGQTGAVTLTTTNISEGTNLYYTAARVLACVLTGLSATSGTIISSDSILQALGKTKYFIDNIASTILGQVLTGFTVAGSYTAITATDTILTAFGKIQKRFNNLGDAADKNTGTTTGTVAAGDDSRFFGAWVDFSSTINLTGYSGTPTITFARYKESSSGYWVHLNFSGGSNATTLTCDLPFSNPLGSAFNFIIPATNSGAGTISRSSLASGSATLTFGNSTTGGSWTATGIKGINGILFIPKA